MLSIEKSVLSVHTRIIENTCVRASWLVQCAKWALSLSSENPSLYQEAYTLMDAVHFLQMHHDVHRGLFVAQANVPKILGGAPLRNVGKGRCVFVCASSTKDGGGWVLPWVDKKGQSREPKSPLLASYLPAVEDTGEAKDYFANCIIGFMLNPTLYMSREATQTDFVREVCSAERVILEGKLIRFAEPFTYPGACSVKLDGGQGGYFRIHLEEGTVRYSGLNDRVGRLLE